MNYDVVMFVTNDIRGDARVQKEAGTLSQQGLSILVVGLGEVGKATPLEYMQGFEVRRIFVATRGLPQKPLFWFFKYFEFCARAFLIGWRANARVYHAHDLPMLPLAWLLAHALGRKVVYDAHELYFDRPTVQLRRVWRFLQNALIGSVDLVITVNEERAGILHDEYGAPSLPVVIHNFPVYREFRSRNDILRKFIQEQGLDWEVIILHQGKVSKDRCPDVLIQSLVHVPERAGIVFLGRILGKLKLECEDIARSLAVSHRVAFHEPVPQEKLWEYTTSADIGVALYKNTCRNNYYCAPNKIYDYALAGLPMLASDFPGLRRELGANEAGLLVNPDDPQAVGIALGDLVSDPALRKRLGEAARDAARRAWNWEGEAAILWQSYNLLLQNFD